MQNQGNPVEKVIKSDIWDGNNRTLYLHECEFCKISYYAPKSAHSKYCSKPCWGKAHQKRTDVNCHICNKLISKQTSKLKYSKSGLYFCSKKCKDFAQSMESDVVELRLPHYGEGKRIHYRKKALENFGAICSECGYSEMVKMLDVHHIDSNRANNKLNNLIVLCVWCHALKTREHLP